MSSGQVSKLLRSIIGASLPPIIIQGGLDGDAPAYEYIESWEAVTQAMTDPLNNWVPIDQRTIEPIHLSAKAVEDEATLRSFVRERMLDDIKAGGIHQQAFEASSQCRHEVCYDEDMQRWVDTQVNTRVSPGFGGIPQELGVAAPAEVRERECLTMNIILQTGITPQIFNHRQMVFLPKSPLAIGVWERK
ncbi:hypothetical protein JG688_00003001 [Phytophthora aleatoria]|uniref:Uncharacterized protein n=1 Tax=Phytophthora aleatoria TaxID=2496075 RepID=A0A8J5MHM1_9STRA|nr:hypothetical protein JG688_00003001 [Phytophthora aleatoria]